MKLPTNLDIIQLLNSIFKNSNRLTQEANSFPIATMLTCCDHRVNPIPINSEGIFTIRNIGNQIINTEGSVDFGVEVLKTPILFILGHANCKAVEAATQGNLTSFGTIDKEINTITTSAKNVNEAIVENVNLQIGHATEKYKNKIDDEKLVVVGAIYDFCNDFGLGHDSIILTNVNGTTESNKLKSTYQDKLSKYKFL